MSRHHRGTAILFVSCLIFLAAMSLSAPVAQAYHDQGYRCYVCHSLKPSEIRPGSNAIRLDQPVLSPVPVSPSGSQAWTGGMPITCDFCHKAADDVPTANFAVKAKHHPVRTIMDCTALPNEIACGDCHNAPPPGQSASPDLTSQASRWTSSWWGSRAPTETAQLRGPLAAFAKPVDARLRPRLLDRLADVRDAIEALPG